MSEEAEKANNPAEVLRNILPPTSAGTTNYVLANNGDGGFYWAFPGKSTGAAPVETAVPKIENLLPPQKSHGGKVLGTNGDGIFWQEAGAGTVKSVGFSAGGTGFTVSGATITSSGTFELGGVLKIEHGGTGHTSAREALNALLPSQNMLSGCVLSTDGQNPVWKKIGLTSKTNEVQYNNDGALVGSAFFTWDNSKATLSVGTLSVGCHNSADVRISAREGNYTLNLPTSIANVSSGETLALAVTETGADLKWSRVVTSVNIDGLDTGLIFTGGPVTSSGSIRLGGTLSAKNGGTGIDSYASGDLLVAKSTNQLAKVKIGKSGEFLRVSSDGDAPEWQSQAYGQFWDLSGSQKLISNLVSIPVIFGLSDPKNSGILIAGNNLISFSNSGRYNLNYSIQFNNSGIDSRKAYVWLRKNGLDIESSSCVYNVVPNSDFVATSNYQFSVDKGECIQLVWAVEDISITITSRPAIVAPIIPSIPSAIVSINQIA